MQNNWNLASTLYTKGPVALGRIFVYFAKKTVNECCRRVRPAFFALTKFCPTLPNFKEAATKNRRAPWALRFLSGDFIALSCLFSVTKSISTFQRAYRYGIMLIQKRAKLKRTSMQQAWIEKISLAFRTKISIFSGFKEQLALGRTCHGNREGVHLTITAPKFFQARS